MGTEAEEEHIQRLIREDVVIVPSDPRWPDLFRQEAAHLWSCLPRELIRRIEHFGSTAVPGLAAKAVIDVLVDVTDLDATRERIVPVLEAQGYEYLWRPSLGDHGPFYAWFIKRDAASGARTHHIHMVEAHFPHWDRLYFRDFLIAHPDVAGEYARLKHDLAAAYPQDRVGYSTGKTDFIVAVTERAKQFYGKA